MPTSRNKDSYDKKTADFIKDVYVVCPSCQGKAFIRAPELKFDKKAEPDIRLVCTNCGYNKRLDEKPDTFIYQSSRKTVTGKYLLLGAAIDPYFHQPLWLSTDCCDNTLWAYNYDHLEFLQQHVEAKLRERNTKEMSNSSLGSRLPRWMTSKKNRETVLKALEQLRSR